MTLLASCKMLFPPPIIILGNIAAISTSSKEPPTTDTILQFAFTEYDRRVIKSDSIEGDALAVEAQGQPLWYTGAHGTWQGVHGVGAGVRGWGMLLFVVYCICVCTMLQVSFPYLEIA